MQDSDNWKVIFYVSESNRSPVEEFLDGLDTKTQARFAWSIEQLRVRNIQAHEPLVKHLDGRIWELRRESNMNIFRILYTVLPDRRIVLLHAFRKKTQKTPRREIELAEQRIAELLQRTEGDHH